MSLANSNAEIVKGIYRAFGQGDVPSVLGVFDPEIRWMEAENFTYADRNPYVGPQAILEGVFMRIGADLDQFQVLPERFTAGSEAIVVEGRYRGTVKATGVKIDSQFAHVWELRGGKVVKFQQYADTLQWARATGAR